MMPSFKARQMKEQGGVCPISLVAFDPKNTKDAVVDHDHITGEIRGILSRSANAVEGKVMSAVARWGGCGNDYSKTIPYLKRLIAYLEGQGLGFLYHNHKTDEEKRLERNLKARTVRATAKARVAVKRIRPKD